MPFFKIRIRLHGAPLKRSGTLIPPALLAILIAYSVLGNGIPALRHDWAIPARTDALGPVLASYFQPWRPEGLGAPQPYPTFYYLGFVLWPLHFFVGPLFILAGVVMTTVIIGALSAFRIAVMRGCGTLGAFGIAIFAVLNPWIYAEYVAGHIFMVVAYALLLALVAETSRRVPREWALLILGALLVTQIEFFLIAIVPFTVWCMTHRYRRVILMVLVASAPIVLGIAGEFARIAATPYNLEWQRAQSVPFDSAYLLLGYQFGYASIFEGVRFALLGLSLAALVGTYVAIRARKDLILLSVAAACLAFSTGSTWIVAPLYRFLVLHVPETGVFRELYDLIAIVVIGYVIAISFVARHRVAALSVLVISCLLLFPWVVRPAWTFFVRGTSVPVAQIIAEPVPTRVAFFPAFQPMAFYGRGAGYDPDGYVRSGFPTPLNESFPTFPVENVLAMPPSRDRTNALSALSVSQIVARPYLRTDLALLKGQLAYGTRALRPTQKSQMLRPSPIASYYSETPNFVSIGTEQSGYSVFVGDVPESASSFRTLEPSRATIDIRADWVDARLAYRSHPEWGTAFGGVTTTGGKRLQLPPDSAEVLAAVQGALIDEHARVIGTSARGLHWRRVFGAHFLTCRGICAVVLSSSIAVHRLPESAHNRPYVGVEMRQIQPWLAILKLPQMGQGAIRYNVAYSPFWVAIDRGRALPHLRLNQAVNVWLVRDAEGPSQVYLVNILAGVQFILEVASMLLLVSMLARHIPAVRFALPR